MLSIDKHSKIVLLVSITLMCIWYMRSPFDSYWINGGDAWVDGAVITSVENAKRIGWQATKFFPIRGVAFDIDQISLNPKLGYSYVYTHWPSGYEWVAYFLDRFGISTLTGHRLVMLLFSLIGLSMWSIVWARLSNYKTGIYFFSLSCLSYWYLTWSLTLGYWLPYIMFLSGIQLYVWLIPGRWPASRLILAWLMLLITSLFSLQLLPWSIVVLGGLVLYRIINLNWSQIVLLMTAPIFGIGSLFYRIYLLSKDYGIDEISSRFVERTNWFKFLFSGEYYSLLFLRIEYYLGFGITFLICCYVVQLVKENKLFSISNFDVLWLVTTFGGMVWWFLFPQQHAEHPGTIVLFAIPQTVLWVKFINGDFGLFFSKVFNKRFLFLIFGLGLLARLTIGYFNNIVHIPNQLSKEKVSGVCATDGMMMPAIQSLVGVPCPHVGSTRFGGDNLSWSIDNCDGELKTGYFLHFDYVPRVNIPGLDNLYVLYYRWRNSDKEFGSFQVSQQFDLSGQSDVKVIWEQGVVSMYYPVQYCVSGDYNPW